MHKFSLVQDANGVASLKINDKDIPGVLIQAVEIKVNSADMQPVVKLTSVMPKLEVILEKAEVVLQTVQDDQVDLRSATNETIKKALEKALEKALKEIPWNVKLETKSDIFSRTSSDFGGLVGKDELTSDKMIADGFVPTPWRTGGYEGQLVDTAGWHFGYCQEIRQWVRPGAKSQYYEGGHILYNAGFCGDWLFKDVEVKPTDEGLANRFFVGAQALGEPETLEKWKSPAIEQFAKDLVTLYNAARYTGRPVPAGFQLGRFGKLFMAALLAG